MHTKVPQKLGTTTQNLPAITWCPGFTHFKYGWW